MQIAGYLCFFITAFFYIGLATLTASKPSMGNDSGMAYGLGLIFQGFGFTLSSLILTIFINAKGGFGWVAQDTGLRTILVFSGWLLVALTTFSCAVFKWEWHANTTYPQFLHGLAVYHGQLWIPLLWLLVCFLSIRPDWQTIIPPGVFSVPFWVALSISTLFSGGLLVGYLRDAARIANAEAARRTEQENEMNRQNSAFIAAQKPGDPIINLLRYSTRYHPDDVRQAAIARIKAHPDWEAKILGLLTNRNAYQEVYYFLGSNTVEHPKLFAEPLKQSILWLAETIEYDIKHSGNLQHWSFDSYGIDQLLRAIDDQFLNQDVDFYPNIVKLQQALNTPPPERFSGVHFTAAYEVDGWLKQHQK